MSWQGFYIDRVIVDGRTAPRTFPTLIGWDQELIRKRQSIEVGVGRFGTGYICDRLVKPEEPPVGAVASRENQTQLPNCSGSYVSTVGEVAKRRDLIFRAAKRMSDAMMEFLDLINGAQQADFDDEGLLKLIEGTRLIVGSGVAKAEDLSSVRKTELPQATQVFWDDPTNLETLCVMEAAAEKATSFHKFVADIPSFSLGLTQLFNEETPNCGRQDMYKDLPSSSSKVYS